MYTSVPFTYTLLKTLCALSAFFAPLRLQYLPYFTMITGLVAIPESELRLM